MFSLDKSVELVDETIAININRLKKYGGNIYPNLEQTLEVLKEKYDLSIVSNAPENDYIEAFLISSKLGKYFSNYIAASKIKISKGKAIEKMIKDNKLSNAIYVGDTKKDFEASKEANVSFVQAKYGYGEDLKTEYSINEISELPNIVQKYFGNQ